MTLLIGGMILKGSSVLGLFAEGRRNPVLGWMEVFSLETLCLCHSCLRILLGAKKNETTKINNKTSPLLNTDSVVYKIDVCW